MEAVWKALVVLNQPLGPDSMKNQRKLASRKLKDFGLRANVEIGQISNPWIVGWLACSVPTVESDHPWGGK